jgi:hypothetical protein
MKYNLLVPTLIFLLNSFISFSQTMEDFSDESVSGNTISTDTGLEISSDLVWSIYSNDLEYNGVTMSSPMPYINPSTVNNYIQIALTDPNQFFTSIGFDLWLNSSGDIDSNGDMGCDCTSYDDDNQLIETISKGVNAVAKNFQFTTGSIKKIVCRPTSPDGGNNLSIDDVNFTTNLSLTTIDILLNGTISAESNQIKNLADPTDAQDAATKNYTYSKAEVDALVANLQNQIDEPVYTIGYWPELGGYVFMVSADGKHGLVAETEDQGVESWYNAQNLISNPSNHSEVGQNFTDWRFPTRYELAQMYSQKSEIESAGGDAFGTKTYWTSNQSIYSVNGLEEETAWRQNFGTGIQYSSNAIRLVDDLFVRSVREF